MIPVRAVPFEDPEFLREIDIQSQVDIESPGEAAEFARFHALLHSKSIVTQITHSAADLLEICRFQRFEDGTLGVYLPKDPDIYEIGRLANLACKAMSISPVFDEVEMARWREINPDPYCRSGPDKTYHVRCDTALSGMTYEGQTLQLSEEQRILSPSGAIILAAIGTHLSSLGKDDFTSGFTLRTEDPRVVVRKSPQGIRCQRYARIRFGVDDEPHLACASVALTAAK